ncbi:MAG: hypothetical protein AAF741_04840 [Bacteroidota bacterium]
MKLIYLALIAILFVACDDDQSTDNTTQNNSTATANEALLPNPFAGDTAKYKPIYSHPRLPGNLIQAAQTPLGAYGKALPPNTNESIVSQLLDGFWVFEFYHDGEASIPQRKGGKGQWFKFEADGTYTAGHWQDWTHSGVWYYQTDGEHRYLKIDSNIDRHDAQWDVQALSSDLQDMGWARTNLWGFQKQGLQVHGKMQRLFTAPTKEQYGIES